MHVRSRTFKSTRAKSPVVTARWSSTIGMAAGGDTYIFIADQDYYVGDIRSTFDSVSVTTAFEVTACAATETPATGETVDTESYVSTIDGDQITEISDDRSKIFELLEGEGLAIDFTAGNGSDGVIEVDLIPKNPMDHVLQVI